jgi:hypothetical protein
MACQVITLRTGERVITELKEIYDGEGDNKKGVCLLMEDPYVLHLDTAEPQYLTEQLGSEYKVRFSKWNPYSSDWQFKMPYDAVMTISNAEPGLQTSYEQKIKEKREVELESSLKLTKEMHSGERTEDES